MKALITGASSGIGLSIAKELYNQGHEVILVSKNKKRLEIAKNSINENIKIIALDLSKKENCYELYEKVKNEKIEILINNAGFGLHGFFDNTNLEEDLEMIDLNIASVHILTKLFLKDFKKNDNGYILNVASSAGLSIGGPLMSTYYATKSYVVNLTNAINYELKKKKSKVYIGSLCPGGVDTNFNKKLNIKFSLKAQTSEFVAKQAIKKMFKKKMIIIPGYFTFLSASISKILPTKLILKITYIIQLKKIK
ncbi:MAG: SDR family NAD(P)-dependent oxidoreductase [Mycoplasmatota bacterium]